MEEVPEKYRQDSLENYQRQIAFEWRPGSVLGKPRTTKVAGFPALQVDLEGSMIVDVVGYVGGGKITNYRSAQFVMRIDQVLFVCSLDGSTEDLEKLRSVLFSFCNSVVLEQR